MGKIYISGKIFGIENEAYKLFEIAEKELRLKGFNVINPMKLKHNHDKSWKSYMKEDIKALCECEKIYMLLNWMESKGASIEHNIAFILGIEILYEKL